MADQIVIELIGDPTGLKPAEDALKELSKISEDNMAAFNKANESIKKFQDSLGDVSKKASDASTATNRLTDSMKGIGQHAETIKKMSSAVDDVTTATGKGVKAISDLNGVIATGAIKDSIKDYQGLSEETKALIVSKQGLIEKLENESTKLRDLNDNGIKSGKQYDEQRGKVNELVSKTGTLTKELVKQGLSLDQVSNAAFRNGAAQKLLGDQSAGATTATSGLMSKLNALATAHKDTAKNTSDLLGHTHTLTTAMGEVGEAIARASGDEDAAAEIKKKTALAIQAISTAQSVATVATEAGTVATTIFGAAAQSAWAAATLGVSVLIAGLVAVAANFKTIASLFSSAFPTKKMQDHNEELKKSIGLYQTISDSLQKTVAEAEAQGKPEKEINSLKQSQLHYTNQLLSKQIELAIANHDTAKAKELQNKLDENGLALTRLKTEAQNAEKEAKKKAADDAKAAYEKKLSDAKALADTRLSITKTGSKAELDARISDLNAAAAIEINTAKGNAEMIKAIRLKRDQDIASAQAQYRARQLEDEKTGIEAELVLAQKGSQQEYDLRMKILAKERELVAADTTLTANQKLKAFNEINQKEDGLYQHLQEQSAAAAQQGQDAEAKRLSTHDTTNQALVKSDQGTAAQVEKLDDQTTDHKKKNAEKLKEMEKKAASEAIKLGKEVADAIFAAQAEKRKAALDDTINKLEAQKNSELSNSHLTAAQKKTIEEKYRREEAAAKLKAWKADQQAKAEQAIINGLLAFTTSMAQQGYPAGLVTGLLAIAQAGVTVGTILSKAPPKFAKGVISLDGPGTETSDSIAAYLSRGESVITAERTKQYKPVLEQIQAGIYQPLPIPMLSTFPRLNDLTAVSSLPFGEGRAGVIDYDKLGRAVAQALPKSKVQKLSFDKKGFSHYLISESGKIESYNSRYRE